MSHQQTNQVKLGESLMELGMCEEDSLARALAKQANLDFVDLDRWPVQAAAAKRVPLKLMKRFTLVPLMIVNNELLVATTAAPDLAGLDQVAFGAGMKVRPVVATTSALRRAIARAERGSDFCTFENAEISVDY